MVIFFNPLGEKRANLYGCTDALAHVVASVCATWHLQCTCIPGVNADPVRRVQQWSCADRLRSQCRYLAAKRQRAAFDALISQLKCD